MRLKNFLWYSSLVNSSTIYTVLESTRFEYLFLKKKKNYTVLEFTKLEYCVNFFFFFFKKKVLEPGRLEYCVNGTRVYQARVPQKIF